MLLIYPYILSTSFDYQSSNPRCTHQKKTGCIWVILFERKPALPFVVRVTDITRKATDKDSNTKGMARPSQANTALGISQDPFQGRLNRTKRLLLI